MAQTLYPIWLLVLVLLLVCSPGQANAGGDNSMAVKRRAEKMIRQLNLFPLHDLNRGSGHSPPEADAPRLVEKQLKLNLLGDSGATVEDLGHHAGYFWLPSTVDSRMFYFFFESRSNKSDPVVIWLTGGPGCSGSLALFYENGPFHIADNMSLIWNDYGWDKVSNLIYVDQPIGTGFSYSSSKQDIRHDEDGVSNDLYIFLQEFFLAHPEYANNEFFVTGESYAGHYIPAFGTRINKGNKNKEGVYINLKGLAIGNGITNSEIQYAAYPDFALDNNLISKFDHQDLMQLVPDCQQAVRLCNSVGGNACDEANGRCELIFDMILNIIGDRNYYDIRKKCVGSLCYDFSKVETLLNTQSVKDALGVGDIDFVSCSTEVYQEMSPDWYKNLAIGIPSMLEDGINILLYAGEYDLICNWLGNSRWVQALEWSGQSGFLAAPNMTFSVDGEEKGIQKSHGPLTFLKVHDAGHLVPMDQPKASLEMIGRWMQGQLSNL